MFRVRVADWQSSCMYDIWVDQPSDADIGAINTQISPIYITHPHGPTTHRGCPPLPVPDSTGSNWCLLSSEKRGVIIRSRRPCHPPTRSRYILDGFVKPPRII